MTALLSGYTCHLPDYRQPPVRNFPWMTGDAAREIIIMSNIPSIISHI